MSHARQVMVACLLACGGLLPTLSLTPAGATPIEASFHSCSYRTDMWTVTGNGAKLIADVSSLSDNQFRQRENQIFAQLNALARKYGTGYASRTRQPVLALRASLAALTSAKGARNLGKYAVFNNALRQAWKDLNSVWPMLKTFCSLGHPSFTQETVDADGENYPGGVAPFPLTPPWLSVPKEWMIRWSYNCAHRTRGFRVEARSIKNSIAYAQTSSGLHVGPLLAVPVDQHNGAGSGTTRQRGLSGPVYLVVHSQCQFSLTVVG